MRHFLSSKRQLPPFINRKIEARLSNIESQLKSINENLNKKGSNLFLYITILGAIVVFLSTFIEKYLIPDAKYKNDYHENNESLYGGK
ncbi:hypothetical protein [Flavihumibacter petaseus]|uniref:Uncharacterized protein n=1 Tax=Flavihumibacter petaseus NBRC 106054 TaxID=1220578 RepID=A0A0E9N1K6_9BACT|nr:hypothetical protein [Flavihumibacter petaseus]GAO43734.1 hypothetical protein FPE01S_02_08400 [Flavihumibacter petaseus NBRC 106054]